MSCSLERKTTGSLPPILPAVPRPLARCCFPAQELFHGMQTLWLDSFLLFESIRSCLLDAPFTRMLSLYLSNTFQLHFSCHRCPFIGFLGPCPLSSPDSWFASLLSPVENPGSLPCFFGSWTLSLPGFPLMSKSADFLSPELAWEHER